MRRSGFLAAAFAVAFAVGLAVAPSGCSSSGTFDLTLLTSPVLDEQPFAGVDTLELRWSRPGLTPVVQHMAWKPATQDLLLTPPALVDNAQLELAALSAGSVVAVGRTPPLLKEATGASAYVGLVNQFVSAPSDRALSSARFGASATVLSDGRVVLAGGATRGSPGVPDPASISSVVDLYDPTVGTFAVFALPGFVERIYHAAGSTADGGVLIAGGLGKFGPTADIYAINTQTAASIGKMPGPRWGGAAATLGDGTLLIVGGYTTSDGMGAGMLASDAVIVSGTGETTSVALPTPRAFAVATVLNDGDVLITGGTDDAGPRNDALVFSTMSKSFSALSPSSGRATMLTPRVAHTATLLPSGAVFIFGGNDGNESVAAAELWSPDSGGFIDPPIFNVTPRQRHAASLLPTGKLVLAGGESSPQNGSNPSPVLDPVIFQPTPTGAGGVLDDDLSGETSARAEATTTALIDGSLLYVGGGVGNPRSLAGGAEILVLCSDACLAVTP
jgi:hypothetical protein